METTARTLPTKIWIRVAAAVALVCMAAAFYYRAGTIGRRASGLMDAAVSERWGEVYAYMGPQERSQLNMDPQKFVLFCKEIAAAGWPKTDRPEIEEMTPYVSPNTDTDTVWTTTGTHRFSVTLKRPDGQTDLHTTIEYRHDASGDWWPDVLPFVLSISRGTPEGHPVHGLLNAMTATHMARLETYPFHQRTTTAKLKQLIAKGRGFYLETPIQYFH